jgi:hypothetical protein
MLGSLKNRVATRLNLRIRNYYSLQIFHSMARLDVPTFDDPAVQRQLEASWSSSPGQSSVAWSTITSMNRIMAITLTLLSQTSVLIGVLNDQRDGPLLAILSFAQAMLKWSGMRRSFFSGGESSFPC